MSRMPWSAGTVRESDRARANRTAGMARAWVNSLRLATTPREPSPTRGTRHRDRAGQRKLTG